MASFTNQATLSYNDSVTNSNVVTGELQQVLSIQKDSVVSEYVAADVLTYVVTLVNSGTTAFSNLSIVDDLGSYIYEGSTLTPLTAVENSVLYYVNGASQPAPTVVSGPPLTVSGLNVPAGGTAVLVYRASLNGYAPLTVGATITNTATLTGGGISTEIQTSETVFAANNPALTISKSLCPLTVVESGELTYTFTIQNAGNAPAVVADNAVVTDTFDPILGNLAVAFNGTAWTSPTNYTYNGTTGEFATVAGQITVPAATFTQDPVTGLWTTNPGVAVLTVTGTV